jgi:hypothetical protein
MAVGRSGIRESNPYTAFANIQPPAEVIANPKSPFAHSFARELQVDPDLARLVDAWPTLSDALRAGIVAMVEAASKYW